MNSRSKPPEHGFWVLPGAELALPQDDIEDDND